MFAIVGPDGELHALAVRPGTDEAADGSSSDPGASANLTASPRPYIHLGGLLPSYPSAELMGDGVGTEELVCNPDSSCNFNSSEGNLDWPSASALLGAEAAGTYQLCVGDAREGDVGTFEYAVLSLELTP